jgi:ATP-binding cassette, subfamily B, bacterial MsbA
MTSKKTSPRAIPMKGPAPSSDPALKALPFGDQTQSTSTSAGQAPEDLGQKSTLKVLFALLGRFRPEYVGLVAVSSVLSGIEGILQPLLVKSIFDEGVIKRDFSSFMFLAGCYLLFGLLINLSRTGASLWSKSFENRIVKVMSRRTLESYYQKEYASILQNGPGYFINRIYGDLKEGLIPLLNLIQSTVSQSVLLVSFSIVLIYLSWQAFLFLAILIPISATVGAKLGKKIKALTIKEREQEGGVLAVLSKALTAFRMIKVFDLRSRTVGVFGFRLEEYLGTTYKRYKIARVFQALNDSTMVIADFLSMFVGALFVLRGTLTFGGYLAFVNTFWRAVTTLMQLFNRLADYHTFGVITKRVAASLAFSMPMYYRNGRSLTLDNVKFAYGSTPILEDFSLQLAPGEKVVIVGPNGSGKTTLAYILSGYLAPSEGDVVLPEKISSVTLPILFPPLKVRELVSDVQLLSAFRLQEQTVLDAFADELSAGQQQKLAIALALSQKADLFVIDEPLANLDKESRDTAINLILERTKGKTLILIMHGADEYLRYFDRVIKLDLVSDVSDIGDRTRNSLAVALP